MQYSVYDYRSKRYDYYEDSRSDGTHAGAPPVVSTGNKLGVVPEAACWRLPSGASKTGSGEMPRGRVACRGGVPLAGIDPSPTNVVLALGVGYLIYRAWRKLK